MPLSFTQRVSVPDNVMFRELDGESVILDLDSESYFGLDEIGTRMWLAITAATSIQDAFDTLSAEYEVEPDTLRDDLNELLDTLIDRGLIEVPDG
jgi:hypothetical protein